MKILICDDKRDDARWAKSLAANGIGGATNASIEQLSAEKLAQELKKFFKQVKDRSQGELAPEKTTFDSFDLVFLDNELVWLDIEGPPLTAEPIAGYIRAYSKVPYIVSLNKNRAVDFDLRFLIGDYATKADLALNTNHLENRGLWTGKGSDSDDGFRPWYWPALLKMPSRRRAQIEFVKENLSKPVLSTLGFPRLAISKLSRHATGSLYPDAYLSGGARETGSDKKSLEEITFIDFFKANQRSLPAVEDREILSPDNTRNRANKLRKEIVSRVVAGELDFWFRRDIIGPQNVLVDVPHLLMRLPFLLGSRSKDIESWNSAAQATGVPFGLARRLYNDFIRPHRLVHQIWAPSPVFWWPSIDAEEKLQELFYESKTEWGDFVFCEDQSIFSRRTDAHAAPVEFVAEFDSPWNQRYVRRLEGVSYAPTSQFAL